MSIVASPTQQGVTQLPSAAHLQTSVLNGTVRVASSTNPGIQNAVYTISGGPITSNVNLSLPPLTSDDTLATLNANNQWTGVHTFTQGLNATGPINTTSTINASSITSSNINTTGSITASGNLTVAGNFNPNNINANGTLSVGGISTLIGGFTGVGNVNLGTGGGATVTLTGLTTTLSNHAMFGTGMVWSRGGSDAATFVVTTGTTNGTTIGGNVTQAVGIFSHVTTQNVGGAHTAGVSYTSTEQNMLNAVYVAARNFGLLQ